MADEYPAGNLEPPGLIDIQDHLRGGLDKVRKKKRMDAEEARMNARKRIGISLASFFHPFWYLPGLGDWWPRMWVSWAVKTAREAGYSFLQTLPCRGSEVLMPGGSLPIKYLEPAWRGVDGEGHGSFWAVARARLRRDPVGPRMEDWLFFPKPKIANNLWFRISTVKTRNLEERIKMILHCETDAELKTNSGFRPFLLEVSPGLWLNSEQIIEKPEPPNGRSPLK